MKGRSEGRPSVALPAVSVVIPARDDARALARCLVLLAPQTVAPLEVVVVDNDSSDDTAQVARGHGALVVHEPIRGIPQAAAAGYDAARGEVIARLDADSRPGPDWVERVARAFADDDVAAVSGTGSFYDLPRGLGRPAAVAYLGSYYLLTHLALGHRSLWGSSMGLRRTAWEEVRGGVHRADPELHDDLDLAFVLGPGRRIRHDRSLRVGVSARSLRGTDQLRRRLDRAWRTLQVNWAVQPPWLRWRDRFAAVRIVGRPIAGGRVTSRSSSRGRAA